MYQRSDFAGLSDLAVLTALVCGEADGEPEAGKLAVAYVVMNRIQYAKDHGKTLSIHDVCLQPAQFSCFDTPELYPRMMAAAEQAMFRRGDDTQAAYAAMLHTTLDPTCGADYYYAFDAIPPPPWTENMAPRGTIGKHAFFCSVESPQPPPAPA